jgi:NAD(P)-dependent dehydrogenase (short-subunit alcohol dehydrogenase family)
MLLKAKIALVTGSTHNIGLAIARAFAREGAKVIVHSRHEADAKQIAAELSGDYFTADMADPGQISALFEHIKRHHGRLDLLVNSVAHSIKGGVLDTTFRGMAPCIGDKLDRVFSVYSARRQNDAGARAG